MCHSCGVRTTTRDPDEPRPTQDWPFLDTASGFVPTASPQEPDLALPSQSSTVEIRPETSLEQRMARRRRTRLLAAVAGTTVMAVAAVSLGIFSNWQILHQGAPELLEGPPAASCLDAMSNPRDWVQVIGGRGQDEFTGTVIIGGEVIAAGPTNSDDSCLLDDSPLLPLRTSALYMKWPTSGRQQSLVDSNYYMAAAPSADGAIILAGTMLQHPAVGPNQSVVSKYTTSGELVWHTYTYEPDHFPFVDVAVAPDGGVIVVGDAGLAKYNAEGTLQWERTYPELGDASLRGVAVSSDGSIIAVGSQAYDGLIVMFSPAGDIAWTRRLDQEQSELNDVAVAPDQTIVAVGAIRSPSAERSALLAMFTAANDLLWTQATNYPGDYFFNAVAIGDDGAIIAVGAAKSPPGFVGSESDPSSTSYSGLVHKYLPNGEWNWRAVYDGNRDDEFKAVAVSGDQTISVAGSTASTTGAFPPSHGQTDALLVLLDVNGQPLTD